MNQESTRIFLARDYKYLLIPTPTSYFLSRLFSLASARRPLPSTSTAVLKMLHSTTVALASLLSAAIAAPAPTATDTAAVYAAQATARTASPTSHVKGKAFDRYVSIWFENTDYDVRSLPRYS